MGNALEHKCPGGVGYLRTLLGGLVLALLFPVASVVLLAEPAQAD